MTKTNQKIVLIIHDVRSTHNVGSLLRSAEGFGAEHVYMSGYTPYPKTNRDVRLPHLADKLTRQIHKTALGAELTQPSSHYDDLEELISKLKNDGYTLSAIEQSPDSIPLSSYKPTQRIAIIVGNEVDGLDSNIIKQCDLILEIPMQGAKESFNVAVAGAVALYQLREF